MPGASSLFRHGVLYETYDGHENGSADAATGDVAEHGGQIQGAIASRRSSRYALKKYPPQAAPDNSSNGVSQCAQAVLFHCCAGNIPADSAANRFNDQTNEVHTLSSWFVRVGLRSRPCGHDAVRCIGC